MFCSISPLSYGDLKFPIPSRIQTGRFVVCGGVPVKTSNGVLATGLETAVVVFFSKRLAEDAWVIENG